MVPQGYEAPFIRVYFNNQDISDNCVRLRYTFDEENDDDIELSFETDTKTDLDQPKFQEGARLELIWGWIDGEVSNKRIVYVQDVRVQGSRENIKITLSCAEKGVSLKGATDKLVHKNKTLPQVVNTYAKKHGLNGLLEIDDDDRDLKVSLEPVVGEKLEEFLKRENKAKRDAEIRALDKDPVKKKAYFDSLIGKGQTPEEIKRRELQDKYHQDYAAGVPISKDARDRMVEEGIAQWKREQENNKQYDENKRRFDSLMNNDPNFRAFLYPDFPSFHKNLPQANKSDKQFLDDVAKREPNGPYIVETRDDDIILKKRNFLQKPIYSYSYGGPTGELIEFNPESKKRSRKGSSVSMGFGGWNPLDKTYFKGSTDAADGNPTLAKALEMIEFYKSVRERGGGKLLIGERFMGPKIKTNPGEVFSNKPDNTRTFNNKIDATLITLDDHISALEKSVNDFNEKKAAKTKEMYNAMGINPVTAYDQAANLRRDSELNSNPGSCTVWGKPKLESGYVITILDFGKKYSGNYYIKRATHEVDKGQGYLVELEIYRQGVNIKPNSNYVDNEEISRPLNKDIGPSGKTPNKKALPVKSNPIQRQ